MDEPLFLAIRHALVICRNKEGKYLVAEETRERGWWLPGGKAEIDENFPQAAQRQCLEEAGIKIRIKGIIQIQHGMSANQKGIRCLNVYFLAEPQTEEDKPKSMPDKHSIRAEYMTLQEIKLLKWRSDEIFKYTNLVQENCQIYAAELLSEGKYQEHLSPHIFKAYRQSVVICRNQENKFLCVEKTNDRGWWLPSGKLEKEETFLQACYRVCLQETGIKVQIKGIIKVEPGICIENGIRCFNVYYYAEPADQEDKPKKIKETNSKQTEFLSVEDIHNLKWRFGQVYECTKYIENGGIIYPLEAFQETHKEK